MDQLGTALGGERQRLQLEAFQRKHRVALLTMVFTDVVGSTKLKQVLGERAALALLDQHHAIVRETLLGFPEAEELRLMGDSFLCIFTKPSDAVHFSLLVQSLMRDLAQESGQPICDRIGIHVGEVFIQEREGMNPELFGLQIDTAARIQSLGTGDQILLSRFAFDNARQVLRGTDIPGLHELSWLTHGFYEMKGVDEPIEVCEVGEAGFAALAAPPDNEKAHRCHGADGETMLGWRPAAGERVKDSSWVLERALGDGGFGEVWLAQHEVLKMHRVIKFCFRAERVRSLRREVTLFRVLRDRVGEHPGIVVVHDVFFDAPPFYLVMDFVDGPNLAEWAEANAAPSPTAVDVQVDIVRQIAEALEAAHGAGVIHRDVKPTNVLVAQNGAVAPQVKLTDFGIGNVTSDSVLDGFTRIGFTQTMLSAGNRSGTPLYMAPEVVAGKPSSARSDLYSLGVIFYQLLIGDCNAPLTADWQENIPDPLLRDDLKGCLSGDPGRRWTGAGVLAQRLRSLPERRREAQRMFAEAQARERAAYRRGVARTIAAATVLVVAFATIAFAAWNEAKKARGMRMQAELMVNYVVGKLREELEPLGSTTLLQSTVNQLRIYDGSMPAGGHTLDSLRLKAASLVFQGDVLAITGDLHEAVRAYDEACNVAEKLLKAAPGNVAAKVEMQRSLYKRATLRELFGQWELAEQDAVRSAAYADELVSATTAPEVMRLASLSYKQLAYRRLADPSRRSEVAPLFQKAMECIDAASSTRHAPSQWRFERSYSMIGMVQLDLERGDLAAAEQGCRQLRELVLQLVREQPQHLTWRRQEALIDLVEARIAEQRGSLDDAAGLALRSSERLAELVNREPLNPGWRSNHAEARHQLGLLQAARGKFTEANDALTISAKEYGSLTKQTSSSPLWAQAHARVETDRNELYRRIGMEPPPTLAAAPPTFEIPQPSAQATAPASLPPPAILEAAPLSPDVPEPTNSVAPPPSDAHSDARERESERLRQLEKSREAESAAASRRVRPRPPSSQQTPRPPTDRKRPVTGGSVLGG